MNIKNKKYSILPHLAGGTIYYIQEQSHKSELTNGDCITIFYHILLPLSSIIFKEVGVFLCLQVGNFKQQCKLRTERTKKMDGIKTFKNKEFGTVRTIVKDGEPWFVGKDVAEILGYKETAKAIRTHICAEDKGVSVLDTPGGQQKITLINESGLYSLILGSKLPKAKTFKRWVTSEALPTIYYI